MHRFIFPQLQHKKWQRLNLNDEAESLFSIDTKNPLLCPNYCAEWVNSLHKREGCDYSYGGYLEDRKDLWRHYHEPGHTFHLGVDYNVPDGTEVYLPFNGTLITIEKDTDQEGGWGYRVIFKMSNLYVIFAHLSSYSLLMAGLHVGRKYIAGTKIAEVGKPNENGNWFPHLHVQCMRKYDPSADGYAAWNENLAYDYPNPDLLKVYVVSKGE